MRRIEVARFGGPEVMTVTTAADPEPAPGEVSIAVTVVGVLGLDMAIRRGAGGPFAVTPPYVPGQGAAGVVLAVGAGVDPGWVGTRVVTDVVGGGAYAERLVAPAEGLVPIPDAVDDRTAAALMHDGRTALTLLAVTPVRSGESVLVLPAAGGLGSILVQLLQGRGALVVGGARGERKRAVVDALGATRGVDYSEPDWSAQVGRVSVVFDGVGGDVGRRAATLLPAGGRFSSYGVAGGEATSIEPGEAARRGLTVADMGQLMVTPPEHRRRMAEVFAAAAAGELEPVIGRVDPLTDAAQAHAAYENREVVGKALLLVG